TPRSGGPAKESIHQERLTPPAERDGAGPGWGPAIELHAPWLAGLPSAGARSRGHEGIPSLGQTQQRVVVDESLRVAATDEDDRRGRSTRGHHVDERAVPRDRDREPAHRSVIPDIGGAERHHVVGDHDVPEAATRPAPDPERGDVPAAG